MTSDGHARSSRVPAAAEDDDALAARLPAEHGEGEDRAGAPGVLRDLDEVDAEVFLGESLDVAHLVGGDPPDFGAFALGEPARIGLDRHAR
jgi:hypothetical protein